MPEEEEEEEEDVLQHIRQFAMHMCHKNKSDPNQKPAGLFQPFQIPGRKFESISEDFLTELPLPSRATQRLWCLSID